LIGLTDDEIVFDLKGIAIRVEGPEAWSIIADTAGPTRLWDAKSGFSVIDAGAGLFLAAGALDDIVGPLGFGPQDAARVLDAALAGDDRLTLLGVDEDSFAVQVTNTARDTVDTLLFADAEDVIALANLSWPSPGSWEDALTL
jgi:hypothetical protein